MGVHSGAELHVPWLAAFPAAPRSSPGWYWQVLIQALVAEVESEIHLVNKPSERVGCSHSRVLQWRISIKFNKQITDLFVILL